MTAQTSSFDNAALGGDDGFARCRPFSVSTFEIEGQISSPGTLVQIQRYRWDQPLENGLFRSAVCLLGLHLQRVSAEVETDYFGAVSGGTFAAIGDCIFIPADHEIVIRAAAGERRTLTCMFERSLLERHLHRDWSAFDLAACSDIKNPNIRAGLLRLAEEVALPGLASAGLVEATVAALVIELARHFAGVRGATAGIGNRLSTRQLRLIEECVKCRPGDPPSLTELASTCGLSSRHLTRTFKNTTGMTLSDYIAAARMRHAKLLLANRDMLIKRIAYDCGFRSQASFAAAFREATGWSPRQFRQAIFGLVE